jgi:sulfopyruvate decarboxylase subunit alpha
MNKAIPLATAELLERAGLSHIVVVPSSGLDPLYSAFEQRGACLIATREEEAVGLAVGLALGGLWPAVVMQQSGVGNCLNAVLSLADPYEVDFPVLVFDRGEADINPVQRTSSAGTRRILKVLGATQLDLAAPEAHALFASGRKARVRWFLCQC